MYHSIDWTESPISAELRLNARRGKSRNSAIISSIRIAAISRNANKIVDGKQVVTYDVDMAGLFSTQHLESTSFEDMNEAQHAVNSAVRLHLRELAETIT